jgi:hypothetical protein
MSKFPNEKFKTFYDYFLKQYKVKITNKNQFLVIAKRRKKVMDANGKKVEVVEDIHLVPELLQPTGMTEEMRNDWKAMGEIAKHTQIPPHKRDSMQKALANQLNNTKNEIDLKIDTNSNVIKDAIIYDPPQIRMKNSFKPKGSGTWRIKEKIYSQGASLGKWAIICDARDVKAAEQVGLAMLKSSKSIGIKVGKPKIFKIQTGKGKPQPAAQVMDIIASTSQADIFMLMFQKRTADRMYKRVKTECN